jgi:hypothetical protein
MVGEQIVPHKCQGRDFIYDFASLGEVVEVEVLDAETCEN